MSLLHNMSSIHTCMVSVANKWLWITSFNLTGSEKNHMTYPYVTFNFTIIYICEYLYSFNKSLVLFLNGYKWNIFKIPCGANFYRILVIVTSLIRWSIKLNPTPKNILISSLYLSISIELIIFFRKETYYRQFAVPLTIKRT